MKFSSVIVPVALCASLSAAASIPVATTEVEQPSDRGFFDGIKNAFDTVKDAVTSGVEKAKDVVNGGIDAVKHIGDKTVMISNTKATDAWVAIAYNHTVNGAVEDLKSVAWFEAKPNAATKVYLDKDVVTFYVYISDKKGVEGMNLFKNAGVPAGFCVSNDEHTITVKEGKYEVSNTSGLTMPFQGKEESCFKAGGAVKSFQPVTYTADLTVPF